MSELKEMLVDVVDKLLKNYVAKETVDLLEDGKWAETLWEKLLEQELEKVVWQGNGGDMEDLLTLYERMGYYAAPIPFVEQTLANIFLESIDVAPFSELVTFAFDEQLVIENGTVSGTIPLVRWGRAATSIVIIQRGQMVIVSSEDAEVISSTNIAAEPRDTVILRAAHATCHPITAQQFSHYESLYCATLLALMTGAITRAVELAIQFSKERQQFGQPVHRFQLVQQHIAQLAGERAIATVALENVMVTMQERAILCARLRLDEAARIVATSAHQVHAAIGVTFEHSLHHATRRLWAWRDEGPSIADVSAQLTDIFLANEQDVWAFLTKGDM
ncbi:MAG: acyl-CoA dehydrogenase family protein [Solibacillus sp.]